ncbi:MAG: type II toxin-antitoxin system VapC family toxin [Candidatus Limnocylindria bacterium]
MIVAYVDSSAIVKLVADEDESEALRGWVEADVTCLTSRVTTVEVPRALRRKGRVGLERAARPLDEALRSIALLELDGLTAEQAATTGSPALRSLDAIHLASALTIASELDAFVTYDLRLADAAREAGLAVVAPA